MNKYGYFRHRFDAHQNEKLLALVDDLGIAAYGYYYTLLEIYGQEYAKSKGKNEVKIHIRIIANTWRCRKDSCNKVLTKLELSGLLVVTKLGDIMCLSIPNYLKYYGSYLKTPPLIKEKEKVKEKVKVNRQAINPKTEPPPKAQNTSSPKTMHKIGLLWNSKVSGRLGTIATISESRLKKLNARLKDYPEEETWAACIDKILASDFCLGKNDRGWQASFDWLLQADSITKTLEGKYDNRKAPQAARKTFTEMERDRQNNAFKNAYDDMVSSLRKNTGDQNAK